MAFFNSQSGQRNRCMLMIQVFAVQLVGLLACSANTALAQFEVGEAVTASASLPDVAITCVGNLAVFFSCLLRGRLHVEMGARDFLATITAPQLKKRGSGLTTYGFIDVVMLSNHTPESSIRQFMEYTSNTNAVDSVLLQFHHLRPEEAATCNNAHRCGCIVIDEMDEGIKCLAFRMPGALKRLSGSRCLLPCMTCLTNGCHGCNQGMLHVERGRCLCKMSVSGRDFEEYELRLTEGGRTESPVPAVCEILDKTVTTIYEERTCICIPARPAEDDFWTEMLGERFLFLCRDQ